MKLSGVNEWESERMTQNGIQRKERNDIDEQTAEW